MPDDNIYDEDASRLDRMDTRAAAAKQRTETETAAEIDKRIEKREREREAEAAEDEADAEGDGQEQPDANAAGDDGGDGAGDDGAETGEDAGQDRPQQRTTPNGRSSNDSNGGRAQGDTGEVSRRRRLASKARSVASSSRRVARSAGSKAAGAATAVGSGTARAVDAAAESQQRAAQRSDGDGYADPFDDEDGGDLDVFGSDDATYRDADGDGEPEALFGNFDPGANVTAFDTDRDGDVDVLFGEAEPVGGGRSVDVVIEEATISLDGGEGMDQPLDSAVPDALEPRNDDGVLPDALQDGGGMSPDDTLDSMFGETESMDGDPWEVFDDGY
jgi:hypothetical protein